MNNLNKEKNFVSAVIYVRNSEKEILPLLQTVHRELNENFENFEIVCVNDSSTDKSGDQIEKFAQNEAAVSVTVINTSFFQGVEKAMAAGVDMSIGDFVFEFNSCTMDFAPSLIMDVYEKCVSGCDIVFAVPLGKGKFSSRMFYRLFNRFSKMENKLSTDRFSIISRRGINRVKSMGAKTVYRKAVYASCGLPLDSIGYSPTCAPAKDTQKEIKRDLALNSLILFTDIGYKISIVLSLIMARVLALAGIYTVVVYFSASPVAGWTTTMLVVSFGFFGLFCLFAFAMKYLSLILNVVFSHRQYVIESVQKIGK